MTKLLPAAWVLLMSMFFVCASGHSWPPRDDRESCDSVDCGDGYKCIGHRRPICIRDHDAKKKEERFKCGGITCAKGDICRWDRVECIRAPCPQPKPKCVSKIKKPTRRPRPTPPPKSWEPSCGDRDCLPGERCDYGATCMAIGCPPPPPPRCVEKHPRPCGQCPPGAKCKMQPCDRTQEETLD